LNVNTSTFILGGAYCREYHHKIRNFDVELPCVHFVQRTTPIDPSILSKRLRKHKQKLPKECGIGFFGPRWISKYIVESLKQYGDESKAYELLIKDKRVL